MIDLTAAGLTPTESKCYTALLERKEWKPVELAKYVSETRTNCYKILDKLIEYKLAERFDKDKKLHYRATNPAQLLQLAREHRLAREKAEKALEISAQQLTQTYLASNEQAGVRYFQGQSEIKQMFEMIADSSEEVVFVHTLASIDFYGYDIMHNLRMLAVNKGTERRAITPNAPQIRDTYLKNDKGYLLKRTWFEQNDYTSPVEWGAFEDKLYIISYGQEALGIVIDSAQIAASFKELFNALERGQKLLPNYKELPRPLSL